MLYKNFLAFLLVLVSSITMAVEIPRSMIILHVAANKLYMKPLSDSSVNEFRIVSPGLYFKVSGEAYMSATRFMHVDLGLSLNRGVMKDGYFRTSRLCMNYGIGKTFERFKFTLSPGLCYSQVAYTNEAINHSIMESRFSPSLGLQTDIILYKTQYKYLGLFIEGSLMIAKPSRCIHQLAAGISWKPSFTKEKPPVVAP